MCAALFPGLESQTLSVGVSELGTGVPPLSLCFLTVGAT